MSSPETPPPGTVAWMDLTAPDAVALKDFYAAVVGWQSSEIPMPGYSDYCMTPPGLESPAAGICHAQGVNVGLPAVWLIYIMVADLDASLAACLRHGGKLLTEVRNQGPGGRYCVIQDPAGAAFALYQSTA